jgi:hypothetical protein
MSDPLLIYTEKELNKLIDRLGVINHSVRIRGVHIKSLKNVRIIKGNFSLEDTEFEDLGELEIIEGDFTIWNIQHQLNLNSLNKIKNINGDLRVRYTKLKSLGELNFVGKNLILRDTDITNLSSILKVGGDIHLPKKYKSIINLSHIDISGKVKYWNDSKHIKTTPIIRRTIMKSEIEIPHWEFKYITSHREVDYCSKEIKEFYYYFKYSFYNSNYIDVRGESNYLFTFLLEIRETYTKDEDYFILKKYFQILSDCYPVLRHYTTRWIIDIVERNEEYDYLMKLLLDESNDYIVNLPNYFYLLNRIKDTSINPEYIWKNISNSSLTSYGLNNINDIKLYFYNRVLKSINSEIIKCFLDFVKKWDKFNSISIDEIELKEINKVMSYYERELRESENDFRENRGVPKIGEGWISETELYYNLKNEFSNYNVIHHGRPKWLDRQHLDIYIEDLNIGIEYMGSQHYQPIEYFGGDESFQKTKERDRIKKEKCLKHKCFFLIVNEGYQLTEVIETIKQIIDSSIMKPLVLEFPKK